MTEHNQNAFMGFLGRLSAPWGLGLLLALSVGLCLAGPARAGSVSISDESTHYRVVIDMEHGASIQEAYAEYAREILRVEPRFEQLVDSYLADVASDEAVYEVLLYRAQDIWPQVPEDYRTAIDAMAGQLSGGSDNQMGDGKISSDEAHLLNLLSDAARLVQCSAISVFGSRSADGSTITARNLEWTAGSSEQLAQLHAVTHIKNGDKSIILVGYLGHLGVISALSSRGIFAAILDSPAGALYSSWEKRSYTFDLRYALENFSTIEDASAYLTDPARHYAMNYLVFFSDRSRSLVLENNFSGWGGDMHRALRSWDSELNPRVYWGLKDAICAVNSFVLYGNSDNHTWAPLNFLRWNRFRELVIADGAQLDVDDLKAIASDSTGWGGPDLLNGSIYRDSNQQMIIVQPGLNKLEAAFRPRDGVLPAVPVFDVIPVDF